VFGGAARICRPGFKRTDPQYRHPLILVYSKDEGARAAARIVEEIDTRSWAPPTVTPPAAYPRPDLRPVAEGRRVTGTVQSASPGGAEVLIAPGCAGWLVRRRRDPELVKGDAVEVRVAGYEDGAPVLERPPRVATAVWRLGRRRAPSPVLDPTSSDVHRCRRSLHRHQVSLLPAVKPASLSWKCCWRKAQEERLAAERRAEAAGQEAGRAIRQISRSERELKSQLRITRDRMIWLEEQLRGTGRYGDAEQQFRYEVTVEWERSAQGSDRSTWPLRTYTVGPDFLPSLSRLEGVPRAKVVEVCVDVLTCRAETLASRELHPLRVSEAGGTEQRVRADDGAKALRVSLQINTPSARRLHFWRLPDGGVELSGRRARRPHHHLTASIWDSIRDVPRRRPLPDGVIHKHRCVSARQCRTSVLQWSPDSPQSPEFAWPPLRRLLRARH